MHLCTTSGNCGGNLYRVMLFNFGVLCTCHSPLWGPSHRWLQSPPICLRWQTGITNHNHTHTQRGWEDNGRADKRLRRRRITSQRGKRKKESLRALCSFIIQTLSYLRISTWFNRKQVVTFWQKSYFGAIQTQTHYRQIGLLKKNKKRYTT